MRESLQRKVRLLTKNTEVVRSSAKLDFSSAANLGALLFTSRNHVANEDVIRANRKVLKKRTGVLSNMRGSAVNLAILANMSMATEPEDYLENVLTAYNIIKAPRVIKGEELVLTAMTMADSINPLQYGAAAEAAWDTLDEMRAAHPLITNQRDLTLAHLLSQSGMDTSALLDEAEVIYQELKETGFKLNKDTLQSASIVMALSDKPVQEKCERFKSLRDALKTKGRGIYGEELAILAALANTDMPIEEIVSEIAEADDALRHVHGYGPLASGGNLRRMYAAALLLQAYDEDSQTDASATGDAVSAAVVSSVVFSIIMTIIMTMIIISCMTAASTAH